MVLAEDLAANADSTALVSSTENITVNYPSSSSSTIIIIMFCYCFFHILFFTYSAIQTFGYKCVQ